MSSVVAEIESFHRYISLRSRESQSTAKSVACCSSSFKSLEKSADRIYDEMSIVWCRSDER